MASCRLDIYIAKVQLSIIIVDGIFKSCCDLFLLVNCSQVARHCLGQRASPGMDEFGHQKVCKGKEDII